MENNTDWQRPVTAEGRLDVRMGDVWRVAVAGGSLPFPIFNVNGWLAWDGCASIANIKNMQHLISRNDTPWDVPGDKRKGRWVNLNTTPDGSRCLWPGGRIPLMPANTPVWLPDAEPVATPEPVRMDAPPAGVRWEHGGLVYLPIAVTSSGEAMTFRRRARSGWELLHMATIAPDFVGYYYPAYQQAPAEIRTEARMYRNRFNSRCRIYPTGGGEVEVPSHVVMTTDSEATK